MSPLADTDAERWTAAALDLGRAIRLDVRAALAEAFASGQHGTLGRRVGDGAGDVTFGIDAVSEQVVGHWLNKYARSGPISLLTEDTGWRHVGPARQGVCDLPDFDHGGPRIAIDPIDGTRNLMTDLRSAWTVVSIAGPGAQQPRLSDIQIGVLAEIPDTRAARLRELSARRGHGCQLRIVQIESEQPGPFERLRVDDDARVDHGYFPFFAFSPDQRPLIADRAAQFFERLEEFEGADTRHCFDDQYISSGGLLALAALGSHRMVVEMRGWIAKTYGLQTTTAKPYDMAGAAVCAQEAGCVVSALDGAALDFPIDTTTPVSFVSYANAPTATRLQPHLDAVLTRET